MHKSPLKSAHSSPPKQSAPRETCPFPAVWLIFCFSNGGFDTSDLQKYLLGEEFGIFDIPSVLTGNHEMPNFRFFMFLKVWFTHFIAIQNIYNMFNTWKLWYLFNEYSYTDSTQKWNGNPKKHFLRRNGERLARPATATRPGRTRQVLKLFLRLRAEAMA